MRHLLYTLWVLCFSIAPASAQFIFKGKVLDKESGKPIPYVSVSLTAGSSQVVGGDFTDDQGTFAIALDASLKSTSVSLTLSHLSYEKQRQVGVVSQLEGNTFRLVPRSNRLKEVEIKSSPVRKRGDTITYSVGQLLRLGDHSLEDAIKRIPGMQVDKNGKISYEGKDINKLYIEGLDLMGSRYGLATRNIKADDVASVEVMENHEPIKMNRERSTSDQAALNVRLKDKAKNTWLYTLLTGAGANDRRQALGVLETSAYSFGKENQSMVIAKVNNMGREILSDLVAFPGTSTSYFNTQRQEPIDFFSAQAGSGDPIAAQRGRINDTGITSLNHLIKTSKEGTWRLNAHYGYDRARREQEHTIDYLTSPAALTRIAEHSYLTSTLHSGNIESNYTLNANKTYTEIETRLAYDHRRLVGEVTANGSAYLQETLAPSASLSNTLSWSRRYGKNVLKIGDELLLAHLPQSLKMTPTSATIADAIYQRAKGNQLYNKLTASYEYYYRRLSVETTATLLSQLNSYDTALTFDKIGTPSQLQGDYTFGRLGLSLTPHISYRYRSYRLGLSPSIDLYRESVREQSQQGGDLSHLYASPSGHASISYDTNSLEIYGSVSYGKSLQDPFSLYRTPFFAGIGNLIVGEREWSRGHTYSAYVRLGYKDIFNFFNSSYSASYYRSHNPRTLTTTIDGIYRMMRYLPLAQRGEGFSQKLQAEKLFHKINLTLAGTVSHSLSRHESHQQGRLYQSESQGLTFSPRVEYQIATGASLKYTGELTRSFFRLRDESSYRTQDDHVHTLSLYLKPFSSLILNASGVMYHSQSAAVNEGRPHRFYALDASAQWTTRLGTLILSAHNIGSRGLYHKEQRSTLNASSHTYRLRAPELLCTMRWELSGKK